MLFETKKGLFENSICVISCKIHIAIVNEPFLQYIKDGKKTIESRFTENIISPYHNTTEGDIVCMKAAAKPIDSIFYIGVQQFFENTQKNFSVIRNKYSREICAMDDEFWVSRKTKKYISLLEIRNPLILKKTFDIGKKDKRGWVTFENEQYKKIILVAGKIGSGKTFWANKIAEKYGCDHVTFSDYIKYLCGQRKMEINRPNLQIIGNEIVSTDDKKEKFIYYLVNCAVEKKNDTIIIDGLRHPNILEYIKRKYKNTYLIYVECNEEQRRKNISGRGNEISGVEIDNTENYSVELKEKANCIINYNEDTSAEIEKINELFPSDFLFDF
jgi:dephospho-CoA kinase